MCLVYDQQGDEAGAQQAQKSLVLHSFRRYVEQLEPLQVQR
jgi:hypothetical protein